MRAATIDRVDHAARPRHRPVHPRDGQRRRSSRPQVWPRATGSWHSSRSTTTTATGPCPGGPQQFRAVGIGALMQQLEQLRQTLAQEGLFREEHKQPVPFLPNRIGLICGTNSAAQRDVEVNARRHWPTAEFVVRQVTVQGPTAVAEVTTALVELDARERRRCHRHHSGRGLVRGPPAVQQRGAVAAGLRRAHARSCPRSATKRTTPCSTWSPMCAPPPRPLPAGSSSRICSPRSPPWATRGDASAPWRQIGWHVNDSSWAT